MTKIFYTSDTHFGQERTFIYSMRTMYFKDIEEMDKEMIRRWNEVVGEEDIVYHLGDFGDFEVAKQLNGRIVLLYGNYERDKGYAPTEKQKEYFDLVIEDKLNVHIGYKERNTIKLDGLAIVHEPEHIKGNKEFHLFGHIHEKQKVKKNALNVGVDVHNFTPVSEEVVEFYRNAIQNVYDDNCFLNY